MLDAISGQEASLASHCYGCRIIQRLAEFCSIEQTVNIFTHAPFLLVYMWQTTRYRLSLFVPLLAQAVWGAGCGRVCTL